MRLWKHLVDMFPKQATSHHLSLRVPPSLGLEKLVPGGVLSFYHPCVMLRVRLLYVTRRGKHSPLGKARQPLCGIPLAYARRSGSSSSRPWAGEPRRYERTEGLGWGVCMYGTSCAVVLLYRDDFLPPSICLVGTRTTAAGHQGGYCIPCVSDVSVVCL